MSALKHSSEGLQACQSRGTDMLLLPRSDLLGQRIASQSGIEQPGKIGRQRPARPGGMGADAVITHDGSMSLQRRQYVVSKLASVLLVPRRMSYPPFPHQRRNRV